MFTRAKIAFAASIFISLGTITYIYYQQRTDRNRLMAGVIRDVQRQEERKFENMYILEQQMELTKNLKAQEENESQPLKH